MKGDQFKSIIENFLILLETVFFLHKKRVLRPLVWLSFGGGYPVCLCPPEDFNFALVTEIWTSKNLKWASFCVTPGQFAL